MDLTRIAVLSVVSVAGLLPAPGAGHAERTVTERNERPGGILAAVRNGRRRRAGGRRVRRFGVAPGGDPWGTAIDRSGNVWFAEPRCDLTSACSPRRAPGWIGELHPSTRRVTLYRLPRIRGNQPAFLAFDRAGHLWFTTPVNDRIGEFDPTRHRFIGQWRVTPGSGPWDLTFAGGRLWYTDHWGSAVSVFSMARHRHRDFRTPSADSNPYGIVADHGQIWFTENNSSVDRVAALNTRAGDRISEYPIVRPVSGTPHLITIGPAGHPWWTEGFANTIATLNPAVATPGHCGVAVGTCAGVQRFALPLSRACGTMTHVSGIAFDRSTGRLWLDDSLSAQVGSFDPRTARFDMTTLRDCRAHPHDGLALGRRGNVWFDEEFGNAIGELVP